MNAQLSALEAVFVARQVPLMRASLLCCGRCPDPVVRGDDYSAAAMELRDCFDACGTHVEELTKRVDRVLAQAEVGAPVEKAIVVLLLYVSLCQANLQNCLGSCESAVRLKLPADMAQWTPEAVSMARGGPRGESAGDCNVNCYRAGREAVPAMFAVLERD